LTKATGTCTSPACCSCRSASPTPRTGYVQSRIDRVNLEANEVLLENRSVLGYDLLVVATGAVLVPEETEGLTGPGWTDKVFTFYTPEGAAALEAALATFDGGRLVVNVVDMPIKCPVAPLEFCFLADWYFQERGVRDGVELTYVTRWMVRSPSPWPRRSWAACWPKKA
jgi:sulfide:quinone oxidoreductase